MRTRRDCKGKQGNNRHDPYVLLALAYLAGYVSALIVNYIITG